MTSRKTVFDREKGICCLCDLPMAYEESSLEHIVPRSLGGDDTRANLRVSHLKCNAKRGTLPVSVFKEYIAYRKAEGSAGRNIGWWLKSKGWYYSGKRWELDLDSVAVQTNEVRPEPFGVLALEEEAPASATPPLPAVFASGMTGTPCTCNDARNFWTIGRGYVCEYCWRVYEGHMRWDGHMVR